MKPAIKANEITKFFGDRCVVDSLTFEIQRGHIFGLLGPNGAGKTTTIKLLLGLLKTNKGNSTVLDYDSWKDGNKLRQNTGVLFEEPGLYHWLTGPENMLIMGKLYGLSNSFINSRIKELAELFGISEKDKASRIRKLSSGNRKKWGLCRAFLTNPSIVFLDEPTSNLDPVAAREVRSYITKIAQENSVTIFLNTHNLNEALQLCDTVGIIRSGKLVAYDSPYNLQPEKSIYIIKYNGNIVKNNELISIPDEIIDISETEIKVSVRNSKEISAIVAYLVQTQREIYEVMHASNPLEDVIAALMQSGDETT